MFVLRFSILSISLVAASFPAIRLSAQKTVILTLNLDEPGRVVSPMLYGLMTEEINFSYDGGLYSELIRNRVFKDSVNKPAFWSLVHRPEDKCSIRLDKNAPLNDELPVSLRLDVEKTTTSAGVANEGYWGIPIKPGTLYKGSFYAKQSTSADRALTISLESWDGQMVYASTQVDSIGPQWHSFHFELKTTTSIVPTGGGRLVIRASQPGSYWFNLVSLFPPTYKDRPNGNRTDLMQLLADMKPQFLRFPGRNYLEGMTFSNRWDWKKTIGPLEHRAGHVGPWRYRSTDGMGLLEFLEWCEDLKMEPLLAVFAGFVVNKDYLEAGPFLQPFVDDALDEIEYVTGDTSTKWGRERAKDGHADPFKLNYVEIGNEDGFDLSGSYKNRYGQFYDAIKRKYPQLQIISTVGGMDRIGGQVPAPPTEKMEIVDEHYYRTASEMEENANQYDRYDRKGPKVFVGEWATREGSPTTNFKAALGDAAWMTGMERNSDLVIMSCYAPLFVNVNPGAMQWRSDLIGYDALSSYGSPSYYAQTLFSSHLGNRVVNITAENIPTQAKELTFRDSASGDIQPRRIDALFFVATRDTVTGKLYIKIVNPQDSSQTIAVKINGKGKLSSNGRAWVLKANGPLETNSIAEPKKIVPIELPIMGIKKTFTYNLSPYSITVIELSLFEPSI